MGFSGSVIKNKTFEKNFRGYDKDEVEQFLDQLATAYDQLIKENAALLERAEKSERESQQLKEVEASLFRTLKAAEDTGAAIIEEANVAAEEILKEANTNADDMVIEAKIIAKQIIEEAEINAKDSFEGIKKDALAMIQGYQKIIHERISILESLKKLHAGLDQHIHIIENDITSFDVQKHEQLIFDMEETFGVSLQQIKEQQGKPKPKAVETPVSEVTSTSEMDENNLTIDELNHQYEEEDLEQTEALDEEILSTTTSEGDSPSNQLTEEKANPGDSITWRNETPSSQDDEDKSANKLKKDGSFFDELD